MRDEAVRPPFVRRPSTWVMRPSAPRVYSLPSSTKTVATSRRAGSSAQSLPSPLRSGGRGSPAEEWAVSLHPGGRCPSSPSSLRRTPPQAITALRQPNRASPQGGAGLRAARADDPDFARLSPLSTRHVPRKAAADPPPSPSSWFRPTRADQPKEGVNRRAARGHDHPCPAPRSSARVATVRPVHIWGPPGIGKSSLVEQFAAQTWGCPASRCSAASCARGPDRRAADRRTA